MLRLMWLNFNELGKHGRCPATEIGKIRTSFNFICSSARARRQKYYKRKYRIRGVNPPRELSLSVPPWAWSLEGKNAGRREALIKNQTLDKLGIINLEHLKIVPPQYSAPFLAPHGEYVMKCLRLYDIIVFITTFFCGIRKLVNFSMVNKDCSRTCRKDDVLRTIQMRNFNHRFKHYGFRPEEFAQVLGSCNAVVTGHLILQCISGIDPPWSVFQT